MRTKILEEESYGLPSLYKAWALLCYIKNIIKTIIPQIYCCSKTLLPNLVERQQKKGELITREA